MAKAGHIKPFSLEDRKEGPDKVSEVSVNKWQGCIIANVKREEKWHKFLPAGDKSEWQPKKVMDRGFNGETKAADALQLNAMLKYVSQYAPNCLYRDITLCSRSLQNIWTLICDWAGLKTVGCYHKLYFKTKQTFNPNDADQSPVDFFFKL